jgi:hypothetical protein
MPINYTVLADVVDVAGHTPTSGQSFLVDTNVWFWMCYEAALDVEGSQRVSQVDPYLRFLRDCNAAGTKLYWSALLWSELAHQIEITEFKVAKMAGITNATTCKEFRHLEPSNRSRVVQAIDDAWKQVEQLGCPLADFPLGADCVATARAELPQTKLDGYDMFLVQALKKAKLTGIVTDDGDFTTAAGIRVFTCNRAALDSAQRLKRIRRF